MKLNECSKCGYHYMTRMGFLTCNNCRYKARKKAGMTQPRTSVATLRVRRFIASRDEMMRGGSR